MKAAGPARNSSYFSQGPYPASLSSFLCLSPQGMPQFFHRSPVEPTISLLLNGSHYESHNTILFCPSPGHCGLLAFLGVAGGPCHWFLSYPLSTQISKVLSTADHGKQEAAEEAQVAGLKAVVHERPERRRAFKTPGYLTQDYVNK